MRQNLKEKVRKLYFDGMKPIKIYRVLGVHPDDVREIIYKRKAK